MRKELTTEKNWDIKFTSKMTRKDLTSIFNTKSTTPMTTIIGITYTRSMRSCLEENIVDEIVKTM
jgi:hypothetical protein